MSACVSECVCICMSVCLQIRKTLNSDRVYTDFLRCIKLYTMSVVSSAELLMMIQPFFT